jgi:hypothetical protein
MAIEPRKIKSYLDTQKSKKQAMMPNVIKKAQSKLPPKPEMHEDDYDMEHDEHAEEAMQSAHKGGIGKPMPAMKGKDAEKKALQAMKAMAELIAEELEEGECDDDVMMLMADFDPDEMPEWVLDEDIWKKASEIVDPEGEGAEYADPYSVIAHLYKKMGGKFEGLEEYEESDDEMEEEEEA